MKKFRVMFIYEAGGFVTVTAKTQEEAEQKVYDVIDEYDPEALREAKDMEHMDVTHRSFWTNDQTEEIEG